MFSHIYRKLDHLQILRPLGLPPISLPPLALRFTVRKWCCCVCRAISGLEAISRSISKASSSALLRMDFGGVYLAHGIHVFGLSHSEEQWQKAGAVLFFCCGAYFFASASLNVSHGDIFISYYLIQQQMGLWGEVFCLGWLRRGGVGCLHQASRITNKTSH